MANESTNNNYELVFDDWANGCYGCTINATFSAAFRIFAIFIVWLLIYIGWHIGAFLPGNFWQKVTWYDWRSDKFVGRLQLCSPSTAADASMYTPERIDLWSRAPRFTLQNRINTPERVKFSKIRQLELSIKFKENK